MRRRSNQFKSSVYTKLHWVSELYGRLKKPRDAGIPLPPLAPLTSRLSRARVALLTSAGVHHVDDTPFDMKDPSGDASFRVIDGTQSTDVLTITHDYYDHSATDQDINCVLPLDRLRELTVPGRVGSVAPRHVGFMGHIFDEQWDRLVHDTAPAIVTMLQEDGVDAVVASPG